MTHRTRSPGPTASLIASIHGISETYMNTRGRRHNWRLSGAVLATAGGSIAHLADGSNFAVEKMGEGWRGHNQFEDTDTPLQGKLGSRYGAALGTRRVQQHRRLRRQLDLRAAHRGDGHRLLRLYPAVAGDPFGASAAALLFGDHLFGDHRNRGAERKSAYPIPTGPTAPKPPGPAAQQGLQWPLQAAQADPDPPNESPASTIALPPRTRPDRRALAFLS